MLSVLVAAGGTSIGQNFVDVAPVEDTLSAALASANHDDVLRLLSDVRYTESATTSFGTIMDCGKHALSLSKELALSLSKGYSVAAAAG